jgi:hypothetical protein
VECQARFRRQEFDTSAAHGCQMVYFKAKNTNLEGFRLENGDMFYGLLGYFTDIWYIVLPSGTFYFHLVHYSGFGNMY